MAYDSRAERIVMFGGQNWEGELDGTWTWDGGNWSELDPARTPPARHLHTMAYDPVRDEIVMFGGELVTTLRDTWVFHDGDWSKRRPATSPRARIGAAMAFDPNLGMVILFGGYTGGVTLRDTWAWDGESWTKLLPAKSPPKISLADLAYDPSRNALVLFGGDLATGGGADDTWTWDGATWTKLTLARSPKPVRNHVMATFGDKVMMYGGLRARRGGWHRANRTWILDSATWTRLPVDRMPPKTDRGTLEWDAARQEAVLFGGGFYYDRTWVLPGEVR